MSPVSAIVASIALFTAALPALATAADVTVVLDFKQPLNERAVVEMKREAARILSSAGMRLDWRDAARASDASFADLVVVTFKGNCAVEPEAAPPIYDELGPLAVTRTANGAIQPFGEVDCSRVAASVRSAMWGGDFARKDELLGRALGRVVAHELVHMLTKSGEHSHEGVQRSALSGRQLIADSLPLSALDMDRLRREFERH
jgi:hypothetical protein